MDLVISRVSNGRATALLFNSIDGLQAKVTGPFGRLTLPDEAPGRLVMVATSVGLAPYLPILKELETRGFPKVVLLLGVRDRSEFIRADLWVQHADRCTTILNCGFACPRNRQWQDMNMMAM
ncbi:MAG: hypothetical protein ACNYPE_11470 [Candidatus Azotimanducaceae bacterium WSBS_2022_MAG_OTU7]